MSLGYILLQLLVPETSTGREGQPQAFPEPADKQDEKEGW